ncbi:MAG TPA: cytochrome c [Candidatus Binataceae bacterium]|nr:cytochrome c [Candidatus Binataceae bacterium]
MNKLAAIVGIVVMLASSSGGALAADLAAAKQNYKTFCTKCHGPEGKGDGTAAATLKTKPRDFTDCARMAKETDDVLFKVIKNGGPAAGFSADMQAWSSGFEDDEIRDLIAYVRTFCKK